MLTNSYDSLLLKVNDIEKKNECQRSVKTRNNIVQSRLKFLTAASSTSMFGGACRRRLDKSPAATIGEEGVTQGLVPPPRVMVVVVDVGFL